MRSHSPLKAPNHTQMIHEVVPQNNVEYITHEDLMSSCPTSPATSQNTTPPVGNSSPVTPGAPHHHFIPHMNPPFIQMTPAPLIPFSPGNYPPHMLQQFFPHPSEQHFHIFSPHQMNGMHSPSPPEQHPMQMFDDQMLSPSFCPLDSRDHLQYPACNAGANPQVFKIVSN